MCIKMNDGDGILPSSFSLQNIKELELESGYYLDMPENYNIFIHLKKVPSTNKRYSRTILTKENSKGKILGKTKNIFYTHHFYKFLFQVYLNPKEKYINKYETSPDIIRERNIIEKRRFDFQTIIINFQELSENRWTMEIHEHKNIYKKFLWWTFHEKTEEKESYKIFWDEVIKDINEQFPKKYLDIYKKVIKKITENKTKDFFKKLRKEKIQII